MNRENTKEGKAFERDRVENYSPLLSHRAISSPTAECFPTQSCSPQGIVLSCVEEEKRAKVKNGGFLLKQKLYKSYCYTMQYFVGSKV